MTRTERIVLIALLACASAVLTALKIERTVDRRGDTAVYFQTTQNIARHGRPDSDLQAQIFAYFEANVPSRQPSDLASIPLRDAGASDFNMMRWHAYYILYPIAALVTVLPVEVVLMTLYVLSFTSLIGFAYVDVRRRGGDVPVAVAFCLLIAVYPTWSSSLVDGQFYPDRLFVSVAYLLAMLAASTRRMPVAIAVATIVCAAIHERAALVGGGFLIAYTLLWWHENRTLRPLKLALGAASVAYAVAIKDLTINNYNYASYLPANAGELAERFHDPVFAANSLTFVAINAALFALALCEWRGAAIAALAMLPNVIGTIGGAEKIGWSTHYHSYYFPILIWAAVRGLETALRYRPSRAVAYGATAVLAGAAILVSTVGVSAEGGPQLTAAAMRSNALFAIPGTVREWLGPSGAHYHAVVESLARAVPAGSAVSTPETGMPILFEQRELSYLPERIDSADYALLEISRTPDGEPALSGVISYLGATQQAKANEIVLARMRRDGYDFEHARAFPELGLTLLRRLHR